MNTATGVGMRAGLLATLTVVAGLGMARAETPAASGPNLTALSEGLHSRRSKDRLAAVQAIAATGLSEATTYLRPALLGDRDRAVRIEATAALRLLPGEGAVTLLGEALGDRDLKVRRAVVEALSRRSEKAANAQIQKALKDRKSEIRVLAVLALGSRLDAGETPTLVRQLEDRDAAVREATIYALGAAGGEAAVSALADVLVNDYDKKTRALAADLLGGMGTRAAIPRLVSALDDADKKILRPSLEAAIRKIIERTPQRIKEDKLEEERRAAVEAARKAEEERRRQEETRRREEQARQDEVKKQADATRAAQEKQSQIRQFYSAAESAYREKKYSTAITEAEKVLTIDPNNAQAKALADRARSRLGPAGAAKPAAPASPSKPKAASDTPASKTP